MSMVVKGLLGAGAVGALATGSYFLSLSLRGMPDYTTVSGASNNSSYNGKIGAGYKHILVDTGKNEDWWKWSFRSLPQNKQGESAEFGAGKISLAFSTTDTKALNKVCEEAYKKSETNEVDFSKPTGSEEAKHKLGKDILKYCSPLGERPTTIDGHASETYSGTNQIGNTNKTELASVQSTKNRHFWSAMQKYLMTSKPTDAFFKRISDQKTVQSLCEEAYKAQKADTASETQPKLDDVKKYCAFVKLNTTAGS